MKLSRCCAPAVTDARRMVHPKGQGHGVLSWVLESAADTQASTAVAKVNDGGGLKEPERPGEGRWLRQRKAQGKMPLAGGGTLTAREQLGWAPSPWMLLDMPVTLRTTAARGPASVNDQQGTHSPVTPRSFIWTVWDIRRTDCLSPFEAWTFCWTSCLLALDFSCRVVPALGGSFPLDFPAVAREPCSSALLWGSLLLPLSKGGRRRH